MRSFEYYMPVQIVFGRGVIKQVKDYVEKQGIKRPCIITDSFLLNTAFGQDLFNAFAEINVYTDVKVNPGIQSVNDCAQKVREWKSDGIIALGGGSSMDTAKAVSVVAVTGENIRSYLDGTPEKKDITKTLPVIAIPTTAGTGSEVSQYAVITDEKTLRKDSITSALIYPKIAFVDPRLTVGLPKNLTVSTGLDVLSHAMESMFSKIRNSFTEVMALEAIKKVFTWLPVCVEEPENIQGREEMAFASTLAGIAMSHCCGTLPHGLGCPLSGHYGVPHGLAVGVLQKYGLLSMGNHRDEECSRIMHYLYPDQLWPKEEARKELIKAIDAFLDKIGCEKNLKAYGLTEKGIDRMVEDALIHGCTSLNPVEVSREEIREIYREIKG